MALAWFVLSTPAWLDVKAPTWTELRPAIWLEFRGPNRLRAQGRNLSGVERTPTLVGRRRAATAAVVQRAHRQINRTQVSVVSMAATCAVFKTPTWVVLRCQFAPSSSPPILVRNQSRGAAVLKAARMARV